MQTQKSATRDGYGKALLELGKINPNVVTMGVAIRSLYLVSKYISLSEEEAQAIVYHDGQYIGDNISVKNKEVPLTLLVHFADLWSSSVLEK